MYKQNSVISQLIHHNYALFVANLTGVLIAKLSSRCLHYFPTWPKHWSPLKVIVFFVHRNGFYTHLNESKIVKIHIVLSISLRNKRSPTKSFSAFWPVTAKNYPLLLAREHLPKGLLSINYSFSGLARSHVTSCLLGFLNAPTKWFWTIGKDIWTDLQATRSKNWIPLLTFSSSWQTASIDRSGSEKFNDNFSLVWK